MTGLGNLLQAIALVALDKFEVVLTGELTHTACEMVAGALPDLTSLSMFQWSIHEISLHHAIPEACIQALAPLAKLRTFGTNSNAPATHDYYSITAGVWKRI